MSRYILVSAVLAATALTFARAQITAKAAFDVASIKPRPFKDGGVRTLRINPDGVYFTNATLGNCIEAAWGVKRYQISGPDWLTRDRYDVIAKTEGAPGRDQIMRMFQTLLADRFKLVVHRETRELPVYSLIVAKDGPKFRPASGDVGGSAFSPAGALNFRGTSMQQFADFLAGLPPAGRPVVDNTGLNGVFHFTLTLAESQSDAASIADTKRALAAAEHVFTDIQDQLGLKLEPRRGPVEILVVDRAERPAEK